MKRKLLLFALLMALFAPWVAAQQTVEIGDGTSTDYYTPIGTFYNYSITEQLYTAEEIGMAGTISSISFDYAGTVAKDFPITVYMANVDAEDLSDGISLAGAEEVFNGTLSVTGAGWATIDLDSPFDYDGTSSLLIGINKDYVYWFSGGYWNHTETEAVMARYTQNDNNSYDTSTVPGTARTARPNIQIEITPSSSGGLFCNEKPDAVNAEDLTSNSATINWTGGSGTYNVEYKKTSDELWTSALTSSSATSVELTNLAPGTNYQARVQSVCEFAEPDTTLYSGWKSVNFATLFGIPLIEEFPTTSAPTGWARYSGLLSDVMGGTALSSITSGWNFGSNNGVFDSHARVNIYGTSCRYWLVTPNLLMENNVELSFEVAYTAYSGTAAEPAQTGTDDKFVVLINNNGTWEILRQWDNAGSEYVLNDLNTTPLYVTIDLSSYAGQNIAVAFYGESTTSNADNNLHIDNVSIDYIPTCSKPTGLTVSEVTGHTALLQWVPTAEGQTQWQICLNGDEENLQLVTSTDNTYTLTGLTGETPYTVKVRAYCSETDQSQWSNQKSFTTTVTCVAPTAFAVSDITNHSATLDWTSDATEWIVAYKVSTEHDSTYVEVPVTEKPYILDNLTPETGYTVKVRANCGEEDGLSAWTATRTFTVLEAYPAPNNVRCDSTLAYTARLRWTERGTAMDWEVAYRFASDTIYTLFELTPDNDPFWLGELDPLEPGTNYVFKVRSIYFTEQGDTASTWSNEVPFTTLQTCPAPTEVAVIDSTINAYGATLNWQYVYSDSWNVKYRTPAYIIGTEEPFNTTAVPEGWTRYNTLLSDVMNGTALNEYSGGWNFSNTNVFGAYHAKLNIYGTTCKYWLVTPELTLADGPGMSFDLALTDYANADPIEDATAQADDRFVVLITTDGGTTWTILREWNNSGSEYVYNTIATTGENVSIDLSAYQRQTVKIAFYGESTASGGDNDLHIDNVSIGTYVEATAWQTVPAEEVPFELTGLNPESYYEVVVEGNCGEEISEESASVFFTTKPSCLKPTDLVVIDTTITAHTATLHWTENGTATEWVIEYTAHVNDTVDIQTINVTDTIYTLTSLVAETPYTVRVLAACGENDESQWSNTVSFTTLPTCLAPTNLVVIDTTITGHTATLHWTENGTATDWVIEYTAYVNDTVDIQTINVTENPYTLTGLLAETPYTVRVLADCGENDESHWSNTARFTTTVACPAPTNLAVDEESITATGATITWNGTSSNYILQMADLSAATISEEIVEIFSEGFEDGSMPTGWTSEGSSTWSVGTGDYSSSTGAHSGTYNAKINHGTTGNVTYLVSPVIDLSGYINAKLSCWYVNRQWVSDIDGFGIYYRLGNDGEWNELFSTSDAHSSWTQASQLSLPSESDVQIGFKFTDGYGYGVSVDDILIEGNTFVYEWTTYDSEATSPYTFEGLTPATIYMVRVIGDCGEDGESLPSAALSFETMPTCLVPTDLVVPDSTITAHSAVMYWAGNSNNYNVALGYDEGTILENDNFDDGIPGNWNNDIEYPWAFVDGHIQSSNAGVGSSTSSISVTVYFPEDGTVEFDAECMGEGTSTYWDHCDFYIDSNRELYVGANISGWNHYTYDVTAGEHTFTWSYTKDSSVNPTGDYFAIDNVLMRLPENITWGDPITAETTSYTFSELASGTTCLVMVQGVCGDEDISDWSEVISFTTPVSCFPVADLTVDTVGAHMAVISWIETGEATEWQICVNGDEENLIVATDSIYTLEGLIHNTDYIVKVRANCGEEDGTSAWRAVTFHTLVACSDPENLAEDNIGTESVTLMWEGESDSYIVQYMPWEQVGEDQTSTGVMVTYTYDLSEYEGMGSIAIRHYDVSDLFRLNVDDIVVKNAQDEVVFSEDFEGTISSQLTIMDMDGDGFNWELANSGDDSQGNPTGNGNYFITSASYDNNYGALTPDNWLIISGVELGGQLTFVARAQDPEWSAENFAVFVSPEEGAGEETVEDITIDLWDLMPNTTYAWQVAGVCGTDTSNWVASYFTTLDDLLVFTTDGDWDNADNWEPAQLPTTGNNVRIEANAIINAGVVAEANKVTIEEGLGSITIKEGGQLKQNSATLQVTMEKEITGYGEGNGNYYLISSPFSGRTQFGASNWNHVDSLIYGTYDLYTFDPTFGVDQEWVNYKANPEHINYQSEAQGNAGLFEEVGYLYANQESLTLAFTGKTGKSNNASTEPKALAFDTINKGWALVGNPYACNAYLTAVDSEGEMMEANYYVMNAAGDNIELAETADGIAPLNSVFVYLDTTGYYQLHSEMPIAVVDDNTLDKFNRANKFSINLSQDGNDVDKILVRFGKGRNLQKMSLKNNSKLYISMKDKDFAVVYADNAASMPVSFKAETAGSYTINFAADGVSFKELVLVDNAAETKVDLLANPSYTFETEAGEFAGRFTIVYKVK